MYQRTKNGQGFRKLEHKQYRQTDAVEYIPTATFADRKSE